MSLNGKALRVTISEHVADVVLLGPGRGNAMGPDFFAELPRVIAELDADEGVRAIVVSGEGEHFTYGLDLKAMTPTLMPLLAPPNLAKQRQKLFDLVLELQRGFDRIEASSKPVICCLHGHAIGGGIDLATACDIRLASADAKISVREVKVAMVADLGSLQRLPGIVGEGVARELAYTGKDIDAARALRVGLVNEVFADKAALLAGAHALAREIAANSPLVVRGIKEVMDFGRRSQIHDRERFVAVWNSAFLASNDLAEAIGAFLEKRAPVFKGE
jgi:enoyl-CoA hydratase